MSHAVLLYVIPRLDIVLFGKVLYAFDNFVWTKSVECNASLCPMFRSELDLFFVVVAKLSLCCYAKLFID